METAKINLMVFPIHVVPRSGPEISFLAAMKTLVPTVIIYLRFLELPSHSHGKFAMETHIIIHIYPQVAHFSCDVMANLIRLNKLPNTMVFI